MKINHPITIVEHVLDDSSIILSTTNKKGMLTYANDEFVRISGFSKEELLGKNHNVVRHPDMPPAAFDDLWTTIRNGRSWIGIVKNRCKNGDYYWVDAFVMPVYEGNEIVEYQSVRCKPTRECVERAERFYLRLRAGQPVQGRLASLMGKVAITTRCYTGFLAVLGTVIMYLAWSGVPIEKLSVALLVGMGLSFPVVTLLCNPFRRLAAQTRDIISNDLAALVYTGRCDEIGRLQLAIKMLQSKLHSVVGRVADSASMANELATRTASAATQSSQSIAHLQSETDQVATAMNEMAATVQEVARNTSQAAAAAADARGETQQAYQVMSEVINAISSVAHNMEKSSDVINQLERNSAGIGMVLDVIKGVAEQTNLLALNAAIEAARAGEHGRGFAVVADEVRTLASRTQKSTEEIRDIIDRLQTDANEAVRVMEGSRVQAQVGVTQAERAGQALQAIANAVTTISDMNVQIASASEEQSAVAEEINRNISMISHQSMETAAGAQQVSCASEELARIAAQFQALVKQFEGTRG